MAVNKYLFYTKPCRTTETSIAVGCLCNYDDIFISKMRLLRAGCVLCINFL